MYAVGEYELNPDDLINGPMGRALKVACEELHQAKGFCPRHHGLIVCEGMRCPRAGSEWKCWFRAYLAKGRASWISGS